MRMRGAGRRWVATCCSRVVREVSHRRRQRGKSLTLSCGLSVATCDDDSHFSVTRRRTVSAHSSSQCQLPAGRRMIGEMVLRCVFVWWADRCDADW